MSIHLVNNNEDITVLPNQPANRLAFEVLKHVLQQDDGYAWSWFCNLCMAYVDAGGDRLTAHRASASFMHITFGVNIERMQNYRDAIERLQPKDTVMPAPIDETRIMGSTPVGGIPFDERATLLRSMDALMSSAAAIQHRADEAEKAHTSECSMMQAHINDLANRLTAAMKDLELVRAQRDALPSASQLRKAETELADAAATLRNLGYERNAIGHWCQPITSVPADIDWTLKR